MSKEKLEALGGKLWVGDISRDAKQRGYRDVWVKEIPPCSYRKAIALARCRTAMKLSPEERERRKRQGKKVGAMMANKKHGTESTESAKEA